MANKLYGYWITRDNERVSVVILPPAQAWRGDVMLDGHRPDRRKEGALRLQPSGRWAIIRLGREPFELTSGDIFRVEVDGKLRPTRMESLWGEGYYSIDGYPLRDGMRAAIGRE